MKDPSIDANDRLNAAFKGDAVLKASIPELESLLKDTGEVVAINPNVIERTPRRADFIKQLISIRQTEKEQKATVIRSKWSIVISIATFILLALKTVFDLVEVSPALEPVESIREEAPVLK